MIIDELRAALSNGGTEYKDDITLAPYSTFKIGGRCSLAAFPQNREELALAIRSARRLGVRYAVVGRASNVLFSDAEYDGMLVFTSRMTGVFEENGYIYAEAGASLGAVSAEAAKRSLSGLEFAYGIPGSVGGAVFMNAGAYGGEMSDVVAYSDYYDADADSFGRIYKDGHHFAYRESVYSEREGCIVLGAALKLKKGDRNDILDAMNENMQKRKNKQPLDRPNAGSTFKRPKNGYAAQMIDECGLKGLSIGDAEVSEKHAGFIINKGNATSEDVKKLMKEIQARVYEKFGVMLESEIRFIE